MSEPVTHANTDTRRLSEIVAAFRGQMVLVVGDFMIDRYVVGEAERISPEAPVLVLRVRERERDRVGGAGFVALNVIALGGHVTCFGVVGNDLAGAWLKQELQQAGADISGLLSLDDRPTTLKTRFVHTVGGRREQLLRVDDEDDRDVNPKQSEWLVNRVRERVAAADVVVLQDYAKGALTEASCSGVIAAARAADKYVLVDPARLGGWEKYAGATLLKPNRAELGAAMGPPEMDAACRSLIDRLQLDAILVTMGRHGSRLVARGGHGADWPACPVQVVDPVGAGDAALTVLSMAIAAGADMDQAAALANVAGGLEVGQWGCVPIKAGELKAKLERPPA